MSHFSAPSIYAALARRHIDAFAAAGFKFHPSTISTQLHHANETDTFRRACVKIIGDPERIRNRIEAISQLESVIEWLHDEAKFPEPYKASGFGYREVLAMNMAFLDANGQGSAAAMLERVCALM
jgi:hypothetical protein